MGCLFLEVVMKGNFGFVFLALTLFLAGNLSAQMSKGQLQQMYLSYLKEQGYMPEIDSDGDILFRAEGRNLYIIVDVEDPETFRILYPGFWSIDSETERRQVAAAASLVTRTTKMARIFMTSANNTSIDIFTMLVAQQDFKSHFRRMVEIIFLARSKFIEEMNR
jgi:hypothetical protein